MSHDLSTLRNFFAFGRWPTGDDLAVLETLARKWREVKAGLDAYIATLTPGRLAEPYY